MHEPTKTIAVTKAEAEAIMDSFRVTNPQTRDLALKVAGIVLEFAAEDTVQQAQKAVYEYGIRDA